ncbi:T9SS type A sorting domain-containing protein [Chryseobacterium terrae]|uniref:T9SS type A sorting domain-containing protein n=1 Tax=Chryseobacterium terrae TaxID=3163299 RepID=A0ABW8Y7C6_9FLAO
MNLKLQSKSRTIYMFLMTLFSVWGWGQIFQENMGSSASTSTIAISQNTFQNSSLTFTGDADTRTTNASSGYTNSSGVRNVYFASVGKYFTISGINTSSYGNLVLKFGFYKSLGTTTTISSSQFVVEVATDYNSTNNTGTFTALGFNTVTTGSTWSLVEINSGTIPSSSNLAIRFRYATAASSSQIRIDDVVLTGTSCTAPANPAGTISGTQTACNSTTLSYSYGSGESSNGLSYYWQSSATGTSTSNLASSPLNATASGSYFVRSYNGTCWSTSSTAAYDVVINNSPIISTQPTDKAAYTPSTATFNVTATGADTYQWQVNKNDGNGFVNVTDGTGGTTNSYTTEATSIAMNGYKYQVVITNSCGVTTSTTAILSILVPPVNDQCSAATVLDPTVVANGTLLNSTFTSPDTKIDVWYVFVPTATGQHTFTVTGFKTAPNNSNSDVDLRLLTGTCGATTFVSEAATSSGTETITTNLTAGTTYYLRVFAYNTQAESSTFTVSLTAPQPCVAPAIATNLSITPSQNSISGTFTSSAASGYMAVISTSPTLSASPVNGTTYNVGDSFGGGTVVKYSTGTTFTASSLSQSTTYYVFVFSYNTQCIGEPYYNNQAITTNTTTLSAPCVTENFEGSTPPANWVMNSITYGGQSCGTGSSGMVFNSAGDAAITPAVTNPLSLSFSKKRSTNTASWSLKIQYSTSNLSNATWTDLSTVTSITTSCTTENVDLSTIPAGTYYIRFLDERPSGASERTIDNIEIFCAPTSTTWNGTTWSSGIPTSSTDVIITDTYITSAATPAFTAKNITIQNNGVLEITSGNTINAVNVTVENGGNLIQRDGSNLSYTGSFKALKNGTSDVNKYAFWTSPVVGQVLANIYDGATPTSITEYVTATDSYGNTGATSVFGKGYSFKTPVANAALVFEGTPNNGTQTFTLATSGNGFNLIGNPYPSSLNLGAFYAANSARISSTFYFWDNKSTNVTLQNGATTTNYGYATFNAANGANPTWVPAPNGNGGTAVVPTGGVANIGQGFIVKTLNTSIDTSLAFNNDMRSVTNGTFFNKNTSLTEGKFWLRLNSEYNTNNTFAVDYTTGALDSFDKYDSKAIGLGSDAFYTLAGSQKLVIQGKESFDIDDVVAVGTKHFQNGNFTITLVQKEGLFNNGQPIYLHDKVAGTYTDLQNGAYTFAANAGENTNRFEIVYKLNVLATSEAQKDTFEVYRDGQDFVVRNNKNIEKVEVFDAAGRKIQTINESSKLIRVKLSSKGVYIVKALSEGKEYTKKIIK